MNKHLMTHNDSGAQSPMAGMGLQKPQTLAALFLSASLLAACGGSGDGQNAASSSSADGKPQLSAQEELVRQISTGDEPAAGLGVHTPEFHPEKVSATVKATATTPAILKAPTLAPEGQAVRVGTPITRVVGQYRNGVAVAGFRSRNGVDIPEARQASYTPTDADLGKSLIYSERVVNPQTGEEIIAYSAPVTVISRTAPAAKKAPTFGPANTVVRVGQPVTRVVGTYENGEPFEGFRLRNGQPVENGQGASYTPVAADIGQVLVYGERVRNNVTGEVITVYSPEITVVAADGSLPAATSKPTTVTSTTANTTNKSATAPTMSVAPKFGPNNQPLVVGTPVTRVTGTYQNGVAVEGFRLRNGVEIANGYSASYTPVAADVGQKMIYGERVRNPSTGEVKTFYSAEVTVVDAAQPALVTAPALSATGTTRVNTTLSVKTGTYRNGVVYARQWIRDNVDIPGANKATYTTTSADIGKRIMVAERVINNANGKKLNFYSNVVVVQAANTPTAVSQPRTSVGTGTARVGQTVTRTMGSYNNGTVAHAIWYVDGVAKGWGPSYTPVAADVGKTLVYTEEVQSASGTVVNFTATAVKIVAASTASSSTSTSTSTPVTSSSSSSTASTSGKVNSVQTIIDDMAQYNEGELAGVNKGMGWATGPGFVVMGNIPRGTNTPSYWQPANTYFKSSAYWNAVIPWLVVFDGVGNAATNTRVQIKPLKLYMKRRSTDKWELIVNATVDGADYPKSLQGDNVTTPNLRRNSDGSVSLKPHNGNRVFHGWGNVVNFAASDLKALVVTTQARLIVDDTSKADDRSKAKYLIHVGADYYPEASTRVNETAPAYYFPGVGLSRAKYVNNNWRAFNFATIDAGKPEPGGSISTAELRSNPPPLE